MIEKLEFEAAKGTAANVTDRASGLTNSRVLSIRSYRTAEGSSEPDARDRVEYSCDAACKNCHCAGYV